MYVNIYTLFFFVSLSYIVSVLFYILSALTQNKAIKILAHTTLGLSFFFLFPVVYYYLSPDTSNNIVAEIGLGTFLVLVVLFYFIKFSWGIISFSLFNLFLCFLIGLVFLKTYSYSSKTLKFQAGAFAFFVFFCCGLLLDASNIKVNSFLFIFFLLFHLVFYFHPDLKKLDQEINLKETNHKSFSLTNARLSYNVADLNLKKQGGSFYYRLMWWFYFLAGFCFKWLSIVSVLLLISGPLVTWKTYVAFNSNLGFFLCIILSLHWLTYDQVWLNNIKQSWGNDCLTLLGWNSPHAFRIIYRQGIRFGARATVVGVVGTTGSILFGDLISEDIRSLTLTVRNGVLVPLYHAATNETPEATYQRIRDLWSRFGGAIVPQPTRTSIPTDVSEPTQTSTSANNAPVTYQRGSLFFQVPIRLLPPFNEENAPFNPSPGRILASYTFNREALAGRYQLIPSVTVVLTEGVPQEPLNTRGPFEDVGNFRASIIRIFFPFSGILESDLPPVLLDQLREEQAARLSARLASEEATRIALEDLARLQAEEAARQASEEAAREAFEEDLREASEEAEAARQEREYRALRDREDSHVLDSQESVAVAVPVVDLQIEQLREEIRLIGEEKGKALK